jgi:hypothetical protein
MADLRLSTLCAFAIHLAPGDAGAQPPASGIKPPPGWTAQPAIATAAKDALGKKSVVDGLEAFGDPAMGCYSVWMAVRGAGSAKDLAEQLVKGLAGATRKVDIKDVVKPTTDEGLLALAFEAASVKGRLRARLGKGKIVTLACWSTPREPLACERACTSLLGALP